MEFVAVSALSHDGLVREHNEDSLAVGPWNTCAASTFTPQTLVFPIDEALVIAVADGLGGHPGGELASTIVVQELSRLAGRLGDETSVRAGLTHANAAVYDAADLDQRHLGMGTTVAGVVLAAGSVITFNVGDSRVYGMGSDGLARLSVDDSPPLGPGERTTSIVTQTMGGNLQRTAVEPHVATHSLERGARYLVCSDGLTDVVYDEAIEAILAENIGVAAAVELWRAAMEAGGPDNITIAVVEVTDDGSPPETAE